MIKKLILSLSLFSCSILLTDKSNAQDVVVTCDGCSPLEMSHTAESFLETNTDYNAVDVMVYSPSTGVFREFRVARTHVQDESLNLDQDSCSNHTTGLYVQSVLQELKIKQAFTEPQLQATGDSFVQLGGSLDKSDFFLHGTYRSAAEALLKMQSDETL